jgi:TetR/AcrR family transcriptional regulator
MLQSAKCQPLTEVSIIMAKKSASSARPDYRRKIIKSAIQEFALHGLAGTTTQAIADRSKISKAKLHYYIDTKDELYRKILEDIYDEWVEMELFHSAGNDLGAKAAISRYISEKLDFSFEQPEKSKIVAIEILSGAPILKEQFSEQKQHTQRAVRVVRRWIKRGEMLDIDPTLLFFMIWGITQHFADAEVEVQSMLGTTSYSAKDRERIKSEVTRFILRGCGISDSE